jgi:hypothetical protein
LVLQVRGIKLSDEEAAELARGLRVCGDPVGLGLCERIERGLLLGTAIIGTSRPEAMILLNVIEARTPERLRELADDLRRYLAPAA